MNEKKKQPTALKKSGFLRSVIFRILAIFTVVSIIIVGAVFYSFTAEIKKSILLDRQNQLAAVEKTISDRMEEITSIAYNIGNDPIFYLEPVDKTPTSGLEMSKMLTRYLVGNRFIEHLAYCRTAEPDTIYVSTGERSLKDFFISSFGMSEKEASFTIEQIHKQNKTDIRITGTEDNAYFAYTYPLPQLAEKPKAHVLILIPIDKVLPLFDTLLINSNGAAVVFDADGNRIYGVGELKDKLDLTDFVQNGGVHEEIKFSSGKEYALQKIVSEVNGWSYVSVIRYDDTLSGLANKQVALILFILLLLATSIIIMLYSIITQYRPISKLAAQMQTKTDGGGVIDERTLLSDTIATLKDDSEQKQKYETAFYEAEAASKAKSAFLSSMSHDIRTPMNAIIGMTAIARKHIGDQNYVDECLKKVQVSSNYLLDIINNVLDMSRIESGRIPIAKEPVMIPALIDSVVSLMTSSVQAKLQTLTVDIGQLSHIAVIGDNIHIVQVFVNILSNAVKFTPEGGKIELKVRQTESDSEGGTYVFTFTDTGIGIPAEFVGQVFETFTRADGYIASGTEGTGLGMAIAKKLVELMGGTISCESQQGHGTTFTVELHMKYTDDDDVTALTSASQKLHSNQAEDEDITLNLGGKNIMLVEDNVMNREIADKIISETGAAVFEANNGKEAVDMFYAKPEGFFDLIFMDIQMPVMNGYEATEAIRKSGRADAKTVPIYAMTANTFDEDVRRVKEAGMVGHIGKPYSPKVLYKVLADTLSS